MYIHTIHCAVALIDYARISVPSLSTTMSFWLLFHLHIGMLVFHFRQARVKFAACAETQVKRRTCTNDDGKEDKVEEEKVAVVVVAGAAEKQQEKKREKKQGNEENERREKVIHSDMNVFYDF